MIDVSRFKVIYRDKVLNAIALLNMDFGAENPEEHTGIKPKFLDVLVINSDGNVEVLRDEAWCFQFLPNVGK